MFRRKGRFVLVAIVFGIFVWLIITNIMNHSKITSQTKEIESITKKLNQSLIRIAELRSESLKKIKIIALLKTSIQQSDVVNDSLILSINSINIKLLKERANVKELKKRLLLLKAELAAMKYHKEKAEEHSLNLQLKYDDAILKVNSLKPAIQNKISEVERIRYTFAPRIGVYVSSINTPDCKELYKVIRPYMPRICDQQLQLIYSTKNIRTIGRKLNCMNFEDLYLFITASGLDAKTASFKEVREAFRQTLLSGDFQKIAITYHYDKRLVDRVVTICKSVYKY